MSMARNRGLWLALAGIALLLAATQLAYRLPAPRGLDASPALFSAARAQAVLQDLVGSGLAHPIGSAANAQLRDVIVSRLAALGYAPQLQTGFVCNGRGECGTPTNIVAKLAGTSAPGDPPDSDAVLLAAHYDSVPAGPGASDDGAGVAAVLEIARSLTVLPAPHHPIILLLTDGEEPGSLGAVLFVRHHPWSSQVKAAVNMDARGTSGPSLMFETGNANAWLMHLYASAVSRPITNSLYYVVYKLLPNGTDFTVFKAAGYQGFNLAFIGDVGRYHTPLDNLANTDSRSLQHQGDNALGALLALANAASLRPPPSESVFFDVYARVLLAWPAAFTLPAALAALMAVLAQAALMCRYRLLTVRQMIWGVTGAFGNVLMGALLCVVCIALLRSLGKLPPLGTDSWIAHPLPMNLAAAALALLTAALIGARLERRAGDWGFWLGSVLLVAVLSAMGAILIPGASYALLLTAWTAVLAMLPGLVRSIGGRSASQGAMECAAIVPALVFFAALLPLLRFLYPALGTIAWPVCTLALCLGTSLLLPLLSRATPLARRCVMGFAAATTLGGLLITLILPVYSAAWPQRLNIEYWLDADAGRAHWWVRPSSLALPAALAGVSGFDSIPRPRYAGSASLGFVGEAAERTLLAPELTVTSAAMVHGQASRNIHYELLLRSPRAAPSAFVVFPASANIQEILVPSALGPVHAALQRLGNGATRLDVAALPASGVQFAIDAPAAAMAVQIFDESYGLPAEPSGTALQRARRQNATSSQDGDVTVVQRIVRLDPAAGR
jgi:hypothetical protein